MLRVIAFALLLGFAAAGSAFADDLLRPGETISGKLRFFKHQHFNGTWIDVYQLTSDHPKKFAAEDEFCDEKKPPVTFHLFADKTNKRSLDRLLGKRISVVLDTFYCSETAWHVGDAVATQWHLAEPPKH